MFAPAPKTFTASGWANEPAFGEAGRDAYEDVSGLYASKQRPIRFTTCLRRSAHISEAKSLLSGNSLCLLPDLSTRTLYGKRLQDTASSGLADVPSVAA